LGLQADVKILVLLFERHFEDANEDFFVAAGKSLLHGLPRIKRLQSRVLIITRR
jgi:hypothetical protein